MRVSLLLSLLVVGLPAAAQAAPLASIRLYHGRTLLEELRRPGPGPHRIELDLGIAIKDLRLVLRGAASDAQPRRVTQHELTSLTVMAGGPHIDLLDWKHGRSASRELEPRGGGYRLHAPRGRVEFPAVTAREIAGAVRVALRRQRFDADETAGWVAAARRCSTVRTYPCDIGTSHVVLRVMSGDGRLLTELVLLSPMGC